MIVEIVSGGLIISACLAIFFDEAVYSVAALAGTFMLTALLYALSGAYYVAIFQFAVGIGTLSILFLSGEMLSEKPITKTKLSSSVAVGVLGAVLALPAIFISVSTPSVAANAVSFGDALWNLDAVDVVLQGLVKLTVAMGVTIILYQRKKFPKQKPKEAAQ
jgi:NADH:ubiquinone oxidoreductase subunit 6 (subunit J)